MSEHSNPNGGPWNQRNEGNRGPVENPSGGNSHARSNGYSNGHANGYPSAPALDVWTVMDLVAHRWHWLVIGGILVGAAFFVLGWLYLIKPKFTATIQLLRYETPAASESLKGTPMSSETFAALIVSPDLLRTVGQKMDPPIPPERLIKQMKVD